MKIKLFIIQYIVHYVLFLSTTVPEVASSSSLHNEDNMEQNYNKPKINMKHETLVLDAIEVVAWAA